MVENKEEIVSNSEQVCHDCDKTLDTMYAVYLANGDIVAELADRNGDRYSKDSTAKHGGVRMKDDVDEGQRLDPRVLIPKWGKSGY